MQIVYYFMMGMMSLRIVFCGPAIHWSLTTKDLSQALTEQPILYFSDRNSFRDDRINKLNVSASIAVLIDEDVRYQSIRGIGSSLESSTAYNMMRLSADNRKTLLNSLFSLNDDGIGMNLVRITIGTSDFCPAPYYSYNDLSAKNDTDFDLDHFSIAADQTFIIPTIIEALEVSLSSSVELDKLQFFASPWSPPGWMKSSGVLEGGSLIDSTEYYDVYARYLAKFVEEYNKHGIDIMAITPQNEPLASQSYPSMLLPAEQEITFIRDHLGPLMRNKSVEIWCFDHNWNRVDYPLSVFKSDASQYVAGAAFHGYGGKPSAMSSLHEEYPDKDIYLSEYSTYGIDGAAEIISYFRNWARSYNAWVTMLDTNLKPNEGPFIPRPTMVMLDANTLQVTRRLEYYTYGHFSKYVRRGAMRIKSESETLSKTRTTTVSGDAVSHVAFINDPTSSGKSDIVVVIANPSKDAHAFIDLKWKGQIVSLELPANSVATVRWQP